MARNEAKTQQVAEEIRKLTGVKTETLIYDFAKLDPSLKSLIDSVEDKDISILVNNVGVLQNSELDQTSIADAL